MVGDGDGRGDGGGSAIEAVNLKLIINVREFDKVWRVH
jgi:hypothetical protein